MVAKGNLKEGVVMGQTRQHARLVNLLGVKQVIGCVNKMDTISYDESEFIERQNELLFMLSQVGYKKNVDEKSVAILPIAGLLGENLVEKSEKTEFSWWG